jgi:glycosyltransferase involved in cell wall biosynthesis
MKKVLIIGHFWPYRGGSRRVIGLAKYLPEFGWQPIILTGFLPKKPDVQFRIIEVPCNDILDFWKKILKLFGFNSNNKKSISRQIKERLGIKSQESFIDFLLCLYLTIFAYPDGFDNWKPRAIKAVKELFQKEKIDAIISIWPVSAHIIAKELKEKYMIPWIADFPDLWSQNDVYSYGEIRRMFDKRLEKKTLLSADALTAISQPMVESLKKIHNQEIIRTITHGFDPEEVNEPPAKLTAKFIITYTGQVFPKQQDPSKLLISLKDLISSGIINPNDIEVRFYGPYENWLEEDIKNCGLASFVKQYGIIPRENCLKKQRESQILLLFKLEDPIKKGTYTGKIFEYLASRRPILAVGGWEDVVTELLNETKAGVENREIDEIKNSLKKFYEEYKQNGRVTYKGDIEKINKYSHREMARKFAETLNEL